MLLAFLISYYFFQRNKKLMRIKAENLFTQVLKDEMKKKGEELDLFYSFSGISSDTIPLTISIITLCYLFREAAISHDFEPDLGG